MFKGRNLTALVLTIALTITYSNAWSFVVSSGDPQLDFRFNNPGARANAMGEAFIGVADDATAAYTNPAGLTILSAPEVSVEYNYSQITSNPYLPDGSTGSFDTNVSGVSFLSYVIPAGKSTLSIFRQESFNMKQNLSYNDPRFAALPDEATINTDFEFKAVTYGISAGVKLNNKMSIGGSVGFTELDYKYSSVTNYTAGYFAGFKHQRSYVNDSSTETTYSVSMLYNPFGNFNVGAVYRYWPEYTTHYLCNNATTIHTIDIPDTCGIGLSYRFFDSTTLAADLTYIKWSDLSKEYLYVELNAQPVDVSSDFNVDDSFVYGVGLEHVFSVLNTTLAVRAGYHFIPDHNIVYSGTSYPEFQNTRKAGDDEHIYSIGFGVVLDKIQIDIAASIGDFSNKFIFSFVNRF